MAKPAVSPSTGKASRWTARRLATLAMLIALSTVGANLKIPSITGTPAFDSFPGFLGTLILGPADGALVAALGHLLTAFTAGFPLTLPLHLVIAAGMAAVVALFALFYRLSPWLGIGVGIALNGLLLPALFIPLPGFGKAFFLAMVVPLLIASALNIVVAATAFTSLRRVFPASYAAGRVKGEGK